MESSLPAAQIDFGQPSTSTEEERNRDKGNEETFCSDMTAIAVSEGEEIEPETAKDAECQTTEFDYMFQTSRYQAPNKDFFDTDDTIYGSTNGCFRARLLACYTANTIAQQISRVHRCTHETETKCTVAGSCISVCCFSVNNFQNILPLDCCDGHKVILLCVLDRDQLWRTMPQCFQYAFGKKTTVLINCFEVFIERPSNLLARAQTFSIYKHHNTIKILELFDMCLKPGEVESQINF